VGGWAPTPSRGYQKRVIGHIKLVATSSDRFAIRRTRAELNLRRKRTKRASMMARRLLEMRRVTETARTNTASPAHVPREDLLKEDVDGDSGCWAIAFMARQRLVADIDGRSGADRAVRCENRSPAFRERPLDIHRPYVRLYPAYVARLYLPRTSLRRRVHE
jgi:hypothetical protein